MNEKILIVDDEKDTLSVLEKALTTEGYCVITADNGKDALYIAKSEPPDLIILDLFMPDMPGGVVDAKLKADLKTKDIPVMILTCLLQKKEREEQGRVISDQVFIAKPYSMEGLLAQVERQLSRQCVRARS